MSFDVLRMSDEQLRKAIYKSLEVKVAGRITTVTVHALLVCIGMVMCNFGGPGAAGYPELVHEGLRHSINGDDLKTPTGSK